MAFGTMPATSGRNIIKPLERNLNMLSALRVVKTFQQIQLGVTFTCNEVTYIKRSARTAQTVDGKSIFYFGMKDKCYV